MYIDSERERVRERERQARWIEREREERGERERGCRDLHVHSYLCCWSTHFIAPSSCQAAGIHRGGAFCKISSFDR